MGDVMASFTADCSSHQSIWHDSGSLNSCDIDFTNWSFKDIFQTVASHPIVESIKNTLSICAIRPKIRLPTYN